MKNEELKVFKDILLSEKARLLKRFRKEDDNGDPRDIGELASDLLSFDIRMELTQNERNLIEQIESALGKIENGTYGRCAICGDFIGQERLKALPFARLCVSCQSDTENTKGSYLRSTSSFWINTDIDLASVSSGEDYD